MTFSEALTQVQGANKKVTRSSWNGTRNLEQFNELSIHVVTATGQNKYTPTQDDMYASDWVVVS